MTNLINNLTKEEISDQVIISNFLHRIINNLIKHKQYSQASKLVNNIQTSKQHIVENLIKCNKI